MLISPVEVAKAFDPKSPPPHPPLRRYNAIWDTGATKSSITRKIVDELQLAPSGMTYVTGVGADDKPHTYLSPTYFINLGLPNYVGFFGTRVSQGSIQGADMLIGMDIIGDGDFAISRQENGGTVWTYRSLIH